jgi:Family of unknown function (DUF6428)
MNLIEFKEALTHLTEINFELENGTKVPNHFHITEVGQIDKRYIDCGGTVRLESKVSIQLWKSIDTWHRLDPKKLLNIIAISEDKVSVENHEIEVEYQADTIGKYALEFNGQVFILKASATNCLASDQCRIPVEKIKRDLSELTNKIVSSCTPGGGCC